MLADSGHWTMFSTNLFINFQSILDKLVGAQNSGKAPAGQPIIPDLATEILSPYDDGIQGYNIVE